MNNYTIMNTITIIAAWFIAASISVILNWICIYKLLNCSNNKTYCFFFIIYFLLYLPVLGLRLHAGVTSGARSRVCVCVLRWKHTELPVYLFIHSTLSDLFIPQAYINKLQLCTYFWFSKQKLRKPHLLFTPFITCHRMIFLVQVKCDQVKKKKKRLEHFTI